MKRDSRHVFSVKKSERRESTGEKKEFPSLRLHFSYFLPHFCRPIVFWEAKMAELWSVKCHHEKEAKNNIMFTCVFVFMCAMLLGRHLLLFYSHVWSSVRGLTFSMTNETRFSSSFLRILPTTPQKMRYYYAQRIHKANTFSSVFLCRMWPSIKFRWRLFEPLYLFHQCF